MSSKPLFIVLKGEYYDAFERGDKTTEFRVYGPRWNERTCPKGRKVILSRGYGKKHRMTAEVYCSQISCPTPDFIILFGKDKPCFAISLCNINRTSDE